MSLSSKIKVYLGRTPDFKEEVIINDDGDGKAYIQTWNAKDKTKPNDLSKSSRSKPKNKLVRQLEDELISILGTKVQLSHKGKKGGSIQINYFSNDDLERILDLIRTIE